MQPAEPITEISGLRKRFGEVVALDGVTCSVHQGEVFGVLGPNGAGKTTTVECLTGAIRHDGGAISVLGIDPSVERAVIRRPVGYQLQSVTLPPSLTVAEVVTMFAALYPNPASISGLLGLIGLDDLEHRLVRTLSGGQRQRLSTAIALVDNPRIAVLGELTTGLDPQARRNTWRLIKDIRRHEVTIVLVTHALDEAEQLCDRLVVIDHGRTRFMGMPSPWKMPICGCSTDHRRSRTGDLASVPCVPSPGRNGSKFIRNPTALSMALALPSGLLLMQAYVIPGTRQPIDSTGKSAMDYFVVVALVVATTSVTITNYPSSIASHRELGVLRCLDATPAGAVRLLLAQWIITWLTCSRQASGCPHREAAPDMRPRS